MKSLFGTETTTKVTTKAKRSRKKVEKVNTEEKINLGEVLSLAQYHDIKLPENEVEMLSFYLTFQHEIEGYFRWATQNLAQGDDEPFFLLDKIWKTADDMLDYSRRTKASLHHLEVLNLETRDFRISMKNRTLTLDDIRAFRDRIVSYFYHDILNYPHEEEAVA